MISSSNATILSAYPLELANDLFANNLAGQVILNDGNQLHMVMCTVAENQCSTAALVNNTTATISTSIFWNDGVEISSGNTATTTVSQTDTPSTININPGFVSVAGGDFHLLPNSKLIGLGNSKDSQTFPTDLDGKFRHPLPTLGCYEAPVKRPVAHAVGADGFERVLWFDTNGQAALWKVSAAGIKVSENDFTSPSGFTPASLFIGADNRAYIFLKSDTSSAVIVWNIATNGTLASTKTYTPAAGWTFKSGSVSPDKALHLMWENPHGTALFWEVSAVGTTTTRTSGPFTG